MADAPRSHALHLDSGVSVPDEGPLTVAAEIWLPADPGAAHAALVCLPGGNMNRRYFDLMPEESDTSFSFARQMAQRGFVVVSLDYLGIGESSQPQDGYALTPELLTRANVHATREILTRLREGRLAPGVPALPALRSIGVGHSMGGMMTILLQAASQLHDAVAVLGFTTRGLPQYLIPEARSVAGDREAVRTRLVELARKTFHAPYPVIKSSGNGADLYGSATADLRGVVALRAATEHLLPVPALMSMLPGNVAPEAARIDVPVFIGVGERDMTGPPQEIPAAFPNSPATSLHVLPGAGHSHFLFPSRTGLFDALAEWARTAAVSS